MPLMMEPAGMPNPKVSKPWAELVLAVATCPLAVSAFAALVQPFGAAVPPGALSAVSAARTGATTVGWMPAMSPTATSSAAARRSSCRPAGRVFPDIAFLPRIACRDTSSQATPKLVAPYDADDPDAGGPRMTRWCALPGSRWAGSPSPAVLWAGVPQTY